MSGAPLDAQSIEPGIEPGIDPGSAADELLALPAAQLDDLSRLRAWSSCRQIAFQWLVCAGAIAAAETLQLWPVTVLAVLLIATRQHALLVLMHDAAHSLISRRRWLNDALGNLLLALPLMLSVARYRHHHLLHHRHLNSAADPDREDSLLPPTARGLFNLMLRDVSGLSTLLTLRNANLFSCFGLFAAGSRGSLTDRLLVLMFFATLAACTVGFGIGSQFIVYWLVPIVLFLPLILRVRSIAEHGGRLDHPVQSNARSLRPGWLERLLWAPCHINRHWEHHTCPRVPSYNLPQLTARLAAAYPESAAARPTLGYFLGPRTLLRELYPRRA